MCHTQANANYLSIEKEDVSQRYKGCTRNNRALFLILVLVCVIYEKSHAFLLWQIIIYYRAKFITKSRIPKILKIIRKSFV